MRNTSSKSIIVGILALLFGITAVFAVSKVWRGGATTAQGNLVAFILNPEGKTDGAILDTGDQIRFGAETGAIVSQQIKVGDRLSATGRAGTRTDYGREVRAESLQIGDQTITVVNSKPKPPHGEGKPKPNGDKGKRKPRPEADKMPPAPHEENAAKPGNADAPEAADANAPQPELIAPPVAPIPMETASANGNVKFVIVGGRGEARGLILSSGEQINLPKEVTDANLTFNQDTQISVEGEAAASDFGKFIRPTRLSIGNQTFSFNR